MTFHYMVTVDIKDNQLIRDVGVADLHALIGEGLTASARGWAQGLPWVLALDVKSE